MELFLFYILSLCLFILWSMGYLFPYTITGLIAIFLITYLLDMMIKIGWLKLSEIKGHKRR